MGKVTRLLSQAQLTDIAMYEQDLRIEVSEAIHIHRRDVRTIMSPSQFIAFFTSVIEANKEFNGEVSTFDILLYRSLIPNAELFGGEWKIEEVEGGTIHFHYGDLRIELTPERFKLLVELFRVALEAYNEK